MPRLIILDGLAKINRAYNYERILEISILTANAKLAERGEHQTWTLELPSFIIIVGNFIVGYFFGFPMCEKFIPTLPILCNY